MKKSGLIFTVVFLTMATAGCVLSVTPDTSKTIFLNPGETQEFEIRTSGTMFDRTFLIYDITDGETTQTIERDNFSTAIAGNATADIFVDTATYTPNAESAGTYEVRFRTKFWTEDDTPLAAALLSMDNAIHGRTWEVVVRGVAILPKQDLAAAPGTTLTYTAAAYPEGNYAYQWRLDGEVVATGAVFDFTPTLEQCGTHSLSVTASGEDGSYSLSREIIVPLAKAGGSRSDLANCIRVTPDGGFIVAGESDSRDIPGAANHGAVDAYAVKFSGSGAVQWQKLYGGNGWDRVYSIMPAMDGGYIVAGSSGSNTIPNAPLTGSNDIYVLKLDSLGEVQWQRLYGSGISGETTNNARVALPTADGGYIVAGSWVLKLDSDGEVVWLKKEYGGSAVVPVADGGFVIMGTKNDAPGLFKLDSNGNEQWYQPMAQWYQVTDAVDQVDLIASGQGAYAGLINRNDLSTRTYENLLVMHSDQETSADIDWFRVFSRADYYQAIEYRALLPAPGGGYWAAGTTGADLICILRVDSDGNTLSSSPRLIGAGLERHFVQDADIDAHGDYLLVDSPTFFRATTSRDIYVLKLDSQGN